MTKSIKKPKLLKPIIYFLSMVVFIQSFFSAPLQGSCSEMLTINSFIHSGYLYSASSSPPLLRGAHGTDTVPEFHAEAPQATVSEGLAQGPYVVASAGVEPMTSDEWRRLYQCATHAPQW